MRLSQPDGLLMVGICQAIETIDAVGPAPCLDAPDGFGREPAGQKPRDPVPEELGIPT